MKKIVLIMFLISLLAMPVIAEEVQQAETEDTPEEFGMIYEPENSSEEVNEKSADDVYLNVSKQEPISIKS